MNTLVVSVSVATLITLAIGWAAKLVVECEVMDVLGLVASCLALGYLAGAWI